jgi:16S rRNA (uracil1498-N3)-methyltransferase
VNSHCDKPRRHQRFYLPCESIQGDRAEFPVGESAHMAASLRLRRGTVVSATDGCGRVYDVELRNVIRERTAGRILRVRNVARAGGAVTVFQAVIKPTRMDLLVEKGTELGMAGLVPVVSERSVRRLSPARLERLKRVAVEAMKQSLGAHLPEIASPISFDHAVGQIPGYDLVGLAWEADRANTLTSIMRCGARGNIALWVGPEGGFADSEIATLREHGAVTFHLGNLRLRAETATLAALAILLGRSEDS